MALLVPLQSPDDGYHYSPQSVGAKPVSGAHSDCLAVLTGAAVNQDGRSSSLTAPNGPAQQAVIRQALRAAGAEAGAVAALQMHGTGTPLGDPIEVGAASAVFMTGEAPSRGSGHKSFPLTLQSSKSSSGHAEPAAGLYAEFEVVYLFMYSYHMQ